MALTKCPECGKEISDKADSCPHCGKVLKETATPKESVAKKPANKNNTGIIVAVVLGVVLLGVGIFFLVKNGGGAPAHSIVCTQSQEEDGQKVEADLTFGFNDEENKLKSIGIKAKYEFSDASTVESYMSILKYMSDDPCQALVSSFADGAKFSKCDLKTDGAKMTIEAFSDDLSDMNESDLTGSMADTKKALEGIGYSCK
ncbi:zinc ribbon domain-containing protein [Candidatus Saccharibacteria bacterium]|nr:zinc ribbon domain-containing protein [Candidatus Saccharibacteria bacterium]